MAKQEFGVGWNGFDFYDVGCIYGEGSPFNGRNVYIVNIYHVCFTAVWRDLPYVCDFMFYL